MLIEKLLDKKNENIKIFVDSNGIKTKISDTISGMIDEYNSIIADVPEIMRQLETVKSEIFTFLDILHTFYQTCASLIDFGNRPSYYPSLIDFGNMLSNLVNNIEDLKYYENNIKSDEFKACITELKIDELPKYLDYHPYFIDTKKINYGQLDEDDPNFVISYNNYFESINYYLTVKIKIIDKYREKCNAYLLRIYDIEKQLKPFNENNTMTTNPNETQLIQRNKIAILAAFVKPIIAPFHPFVDSNKFIEANIDKVADDFSYVDEDFIITEGQLTSVGGGFATILNDVITFRWETRYGVNGKPTDLVMIGAHKDGDSSWSFLPAPVLRSAETADLTLPGADVGHSWACIITYSETTNGRVLMVSNNYWNGQSK